LRALLLILSTLAFSLPAKELVVGVQKIAYYPHYDFTGEQPRGYIYDLLALFSQHSDYKFSYIPLPVKRLHHEMLINQSIDLVYPDNPAWIGARFKGYKLSFSQPLVNILGGTMVLAKNKGKGFTEFNSLTVTHGFTPVEWLKVRPYHPFKLFEVPDAISALKLVAMGRADGADVEYHVARYLISQDQSLSDLVLDPDLPFSSAGFHLSSIKQSQLIAELDSFIRQNPAEVRQLKAKHQLMDSLPSGSGSMTTKE